jgi:hypothetical protein
MGIYLAENREVKVEKESFANYPIVGNHYIVKTIISGYVFLA